MESKIITPGLINKFLENLRLHGRSVTTIRSYHLDLQSYADFLDGREACAELTSEYKGNLIRSGYAPSSINTKLASISSFFSYMGWKGCGTQREKIQDDSYISENAELTQEEYKALLDAAKSDRDRLVMETLCATGIHVSEIKYFTLEGVREGQIIVEYKQKIRRIMIPSDLGRALEDYAQENGIKSGNIFLGRKGIPLGRRRIWSIMKEAGKSAGILSSKVYPHSLRRLFARTFLDAGGTLPQLCDALGLNSIEATRLYIKTSGEVPRHLVESMGLTSPKKTP